MVGNIHRSLDALRRGHRFVTHDVWRLGRPGEKVPNGFIIKNIRVAVLVLTGLVKDDLLLRASALTFTTMLSVVPFLAVMFWFVNTFNLQEEVYQYLYDTISRVALHETAAPPPTPEAVPGAQPPKQLQEDMVRLFFGRDSTSPPNTSDSFDPLRYVVEHAERSIHSKTLGFSGFLLMLVTVFGLMSNIEYAFNRIWGLNRSRSWHRMFSDYTLITILLPVLAAGGLAITAVLSSPALTEQLGAMSLLLRGGQLALLAIAFTGLYKFIPNTLVKLRYALLGGVVAALLWHLPTQAYVKSQVGLANYSLFYSGFAQVPLLLLYIYACWIVILFGAELAFACQNEQTYAMERHAADASHAYREALAVKAAVETARRFNAGDVGLSAREAARAWNVPLRLVNDTLFHLETAGLLRRVATEPVTYQPARPLEQIRVFDVKRAIRELGEDPSELREDPVMGAWFASQPASEEAMTLAAVVKSLEEAFSPESSV